MYGWGPVSQKIINIKFSEDSNATIREYSEIRITLARRLGACDRVYYDPADNHDWIYRTPKILTKPSGKRLTLRSHTTGEFHGRHTGSILPSQFQKTIVRKLSMRRGLKNYETCFEHSRSRPKSPFVRNHMTTCKKILWEIIAQKAFSLKIS